MKINLVIDFSGSMLQQSKRSVINYLILSLKQKISILKNLSKNEVHLFIWAETLSAVDIMTFNLEGESFEELFTSSQVSLDTVLNTSQLINSHSLTIIVTDGHIKVIKSDDYAKKNLNRIYYTLVGPDSISDRIKYYLGINKINQENLFFFIESILSREHIAKLKPSMVDIDLLDL